MLHLMLRPSSFPTLTSGVAAMIQYVQ
uniref:(California timema) hypothetical protein n=1 Tax=Timema californicum TaxID=61474 RepID=A0A7R9JIP1_TIMCA|nr:unnamed protein product [Timema californicum]